MKTQYVLVDFENVQPKNVGLLSGGRFKVKVFLGSNQGKVPLELASALQSLGSDAEYVQITGNGSNALDFHIAYYIGRLSAEDSGADFHVISKDTGFDPLIKHLKGKGISCQRWKAVTDIPLLKIANPVSTPEKVDAVIGNLVKRKSARPRTLKTLRSTIQSIFVNKLEDDEVDRLVEQLKGRGVIKVTDSKLQYKLP